MSQQGPIIVVTNAGRPVFVRALDAAGVFPIINTPGRDASRAVEQLAPAAIIVASEVVESGFDALARQVAARKPYLPLIAIDPRNSLPANGARSPSPEDYSGCIAAEPCCWATPRAESTPSPEKDFASPFGKPRCSAIASRAETSLAIKKAIDRSSAVPR